MIKGKVRQVNKHDRMDQDHKDFVNILDRIFHILDSLLNIQHANQLSPKKQQMDAVYFLNNLKSLILERLSKTLTSISSIRLLYNENFFNLVRFLNELEPILLSL